MFLLSFRICKRVYKVEYEGFHHICAHCGCYGHRKENCPLLQDNASLSGNFERKNLIKPLATIVSEEEFRSWILVQQNPRRRSQNLWDHVAKDMKILGRKN